MSPGRRVPRLCSALLSRTLPPAGGAASLLSCRLLVQPSALHSDCPGGGSREDDQGAQEACGAPSSGRGRLLRRAWGRSLSPLDRVSRMIPPEFLSREVQDLQSPELPNLQGEGSPDQVPLSSLGGALHGVEDEVTPLQASPRTLPSDLGNLEVPQSKGNAEETSGLQPPASSVPPAPFVAPEADGVPSPPQGAPFRHGDLVLAEYKRKHFSMFKKMFLLKQRGKLVSNWGAIGNQDIVGKLPAQMLRTSTGHPLLLRRPSLEEYVTFMKRGPNIAYPKDIQAMMMAMDVSPGDVVLEAGSGSGALSLFLSRAVGSDGLVYSFEVREDHHEVAKKNFSTWRKAWEIRSGRTWPDNVRFINKSIRDASPDIRAVTFDAAALDMLNPQVALPVITGNLKQGAVCAVYLTNVTQVIDLLEGIRCCELPLMCERIIEVYVTNWLVAPSLRKDGSVSRRVEPEEEDEEIDEDDNGPATSEAFGHVPYIARPLPWQTGHTAFLVLLRKFKAAPPPEQEDSN